MFPKKCDASIHRKRRLRLRFNRLYLQKGLRILPNLFTLGNAFFGFCSIVFASYGDLVAAAYFILLGALMDGLDGRIARYVHVTSEFGMQLDSLCDGISFGLAPAMLVYVWQLKKIGGVGFLACAIFLLAGLLRLARFNITHTQQSRFFLGTPIPIAGCFLATLVLNTRNLIFNPAATILLLLLVLTLAGCMVSSIPFPTFKQLSKSTYAISLIALSVVAVTMGLVKVLLILFVGYFLFALEEYFRARLQNSKTYKKI